MSNISNALNNFSTNPLVTAFSSVASSTAQDKLMDGETWNGDVNYSALGSDFQSALLALDQKMVLPESCRKSGKLDETTYSYLHQLFVDVLGTIRSKSELERSSAFNLLFRYMMYVRSVRVPGKKARTLFYFMFEHMVKEFPKTCYALMSLVPEFGYFGDLDKMILHFKGDPLMIKALEQVYIDNLSTDCQQIFGTSLQLVTKDQAMALNNKLKLMSVEELRTFIDKRRITLAAKWFKREGKKNSGHRTEIIKTIYSLDDSTFDRKSLNYYQMVFRHIITTLTQCIVVGEQMMCEQRSEGRTWACIPIDTMPAAFVTKYRKALANEALKEPISEFQSETGNRHPDSEDRVKCRQHLLTTLINGKLKGAAQDINRLSKIIYPSIVRGHLQITTLSATERLVISSQWRDLVLKLKTEIDETVNKLRDEAAVAGMPFIDPRNVIPIVDTSGSMSSAEVQDSAIGLGILASQLSSMPGCLISFSEKPEVFHLKMSETDTADVFDHFAAIINGPSGLSTNIDATYRVLLKLMVDSNVKETDFAMLVLTDGQFDQLVQFDSAQTSNYYRHQRELPSITFQKTFIQRMEHAFNECGYNFPRTIFWNLNGGSPGFPATGSSKGIQLVSGYSQTLMLQVFTGDYHYEVQEDGTVKIAVDPLTSFLKALQHEGYNSVTDTLARVGEGCLKHVLPS